MRVGFIGTGPVTAAIVTGLRSGAGPATSIVLSPRNRKIAAGLQPAGQLTGSPFTHFPRLAPWGAGGQLRARRTD